MESLNERLDATSSFILQSPPGEVNDVFSDIREAGFVLDGALESGLVPALRDYNLEQFTTVEHGNARILLCHDALLVSSSDAEERMVDPKTRRSFLFDHMQLVNLSLFSLYERFLCLKGQGCERCGKTPSGWEEVMVDERAEEVRAALQATVEAYAEEHYHLAASAVFHLDPLPPTTTVTKADATASEEEAPAVDVGTDGVAPHEDGGEEMKEDEEKLTVEEATQTEEIAAPVSEPVAASGATPKAEAPRQKRFSICMVGNKYNPANFWCRGPRFPSLDLP